LFQVFIVVIVINMECNLFAILLLPY